MSHPEFTTQSVLEAVGGQRRRNTYALSRGVGVCNECGSRIDAGEPVVFYAVYKDFPNARGKVWQTIATFCSKPGANRCTKGTLDDVTDENVGQPGGRPNCPRYWSFAPEAMIQGTYSKCPGYKTSKMVRKNVAQVIDHSFDMELLDDEAEVSE